MKNKHIWILDDDENIREIMKIILKGAGFEITLLASENELHKQLKNQTPDLLFLDILLSGSDGRDIATKLKSNPKHNTIPLVMMSASNRFLNKKEISNTEDILNKPFDMDELIRIAKKNTNK